MSGMTRNMFGIYLCMFLQNEFLFLSFRIYLCKQWQELCVFNDHTSLATGVRFGANADYLASTSMDRTVKFYGLDKK